MRLSGKKAIVTGANRSIGRAIALAFAKEGADVAISYRSDEAGALETVNAIQKMGRSGKALHADFAENKETEAFFKQALDFLGRVDILVNNAAAYDTTPFLQLQIDKFEYLLKVGVAAPMFLTQIVAKHMIAKKIPGNIISISAISGNRPYPNRVGLATTKAALNMLTQNTALDLAPYDIRVNAISAGSTPYEESNALNPDIPLKRAGKPIDHAHAAVFLASEEASWITGQIITVDGGQSLSF